MATLPVRLHTAQQPQVSLASAGVQDCLAAPSMTTRRTARLRQGVPRLADTTYEHINQTA